jgi:AI-2 transport protein TqsA
VNIQTQPFSSTIKFFVAFAAAAITLWAISEGRAMINSLILGAIVVVSFTPLMYWLRDKTTTWLAYTLTLLAILLVLVVLVLFLIVSVNRFAEALPKYSAQLDDMLLSVQESLMSLGIDRIDFQEITEVLDPGKILQFTGAFLSGLVGAFSNFALMALIIIFLLLDTLSLPQKIAPHIQLGNSTVDRIYNFGQNVRSYVLLTTILGLATGVLETVFFIIMGVDFPVLWGFLAFLMSFIPTIGFLLALIPPVFLALLESGGIAAIIVFVGILIISGIVGYIVKPKYMGGNLDLSPLTTVLSVVFWSAILGPLGAILSVPVTMAFKELLLEPDPANRWVADIMSASDEEQIRARQVAAMAAAGQVPEPKEETEEASS